MHTHTPTNKQTGPITIHCAAASLARSVKRTATARHKEIINWKFMSMDKKWNK